MTRNLPIFRSLLDIGIRSDFEFWKVSPNGRDVKILVKLDDGGSGLDEHDDGLDEHDDGLDEHDDGLEGSKIYKMMGLKDKDKINIKVLKYFIL